MGSWNHTCAITQLPITASEDVVELWLFGSYKLNPVNSFSHMSYSGDMFTPLSIPLYAEYNDYGACEDYSDPEWMTNMALKVIADRLIQREQGENPCHDHAVVSSEILDFETLHSIDHGGRLQHNAYNGPAPIKHCVIRRDVWNRILNDFSYENWITNSTVRFSDVAASFERDIALVMEELANPEDKIVLDAEALQTDDEQKIRLMNRMARYGFGGRWPGLPNYDWKERPVWMNFLTNEGHRMCVGGLGFDIVTYEELGAERYVELLRRQLEFTWINMFMESARKLWSPQTGQGSQSETSMPAAKVLADIYSAAVKAQEERYNED